ncbi:MAG: PfkB family carbohydrate kinase [Chthoniobacterales bacterium]
MPDVSSKKWDIIGLGCVSVDELLYVPKFPTADAKTLVSCRERQCGGLTGTALITASRLGARCAYAGLLGLDAASQLVEENFRNENVDASYAPREKDASVPRSIIIVATETGTRSIFYHINGRLGAHETLPEQAMLCSAHALFLDQYGMKGNLRAARIARASGLLTVADFEDDTDQQFAEVLTLIDHLVLPEQFAQKIAGSTSPRSVVERLWCTGRQAVVVTCGVAGTWFGGHDGVLRHQPAFRVVVADTTGCGDVFHGAYAEALVRGASVTECVKFASAAAALKATQPGGQRGIPKRADVDRFLNSSPETY